MNTRLYGGIDLHSNNSVIVIINENDKILYQKRLNNDLDRMLDELAPYKAALQGVVVESTYNWYWLVDGLQDEAYKVHLANTAAIQPYTGLKYTDDNHDAFWLARLLRLNILTDGYIYPREQRGVRELLRKRIILVQQRTMNILGIQSMINRYENIKFTADKLKRSKENEEKILNNIRDIHVKKAAQSQLKILFVIMDQIDFLEKELLTKLKRDSFFDLLKTIPGVGPILAMTILLETGEIKRFKDVGNYSSYCRCVESKRISNEKKKGKNNRKNGNNYLGWAFMEATHHAIKNYEEVKSYYQRKLAKSKRVVALKTIANKLSKATYFILRDGVQFDMKKSFG